MRILILFLLLCLPLSAKASPFKSHHHHHHNHDSASLLNRADILQHNHHFDQALKVLDKVIISDNHPRAYLMRAVIYQTRGEYDLGLKDCKSLVGKTSLLVATTCISHINSLTGQLSSSYDLLRDTYKKHKENAKDEIKSWSLAVLADMATRLGEQKEAKKYYNKGLEINSKDYHMLALYSDLLLTSGKYLELRKLLKNNTHIDKLYLRLALLEKEMKGKDLDLYKKNLNKRYNSEKDHYHLRELARYYLELLEDNKLAYQYAQENWQVAKEPEDAIILIKAAIAFGEKQKVKEVLETLANIGLEDKRLDQYKDYL